MSDPNENYLDEVDDAPKFQPVKVITRSAPSSSNAAVDSKELAALKAALPVDALEDFVVDTATEELRPDALDFSFRFKKRISATRNRYARDSYEVLLGRPSDDTAASAKQAAAEAPSAAASAAPAKTKLKVMKSYTPRPAATPVAALPSSSSSSDDDLGFGQMVLASAAAATSPDDDGADAMSLVTWEHNINWQGSGSGSGSEGDASAFDIKVSSRSRPLDHNRISVEHAQLLAVHSSCADHPNTSLLGAHAAAAAAPAPKPEPLTLRNTSLLSCQWLDNVLWARQRRRKGARRPPSGQITISRHVRDSTLPSVYYCNIWSGTPAR